VLKESLLQNKRKRRKKGRNKEEQKERKAWKEGNILNKEN
jgi:hypothetical protein